MTANASAAPVAAPNVKVTGRRILATIVDGIVFMILSFILGAIFGGNSASGGSVSVALSGISALLDFVIVVAYYVLLEGYLGQTLGKMLLGIKVVRQEDGEVPGVGKAALRTLLRIIDGLFAYLVAFIVVLISGKNQRLGDMAADTLVVRK